MSVWEAVAEIMEELCQDVKWFTPKISLGTFQLLLTRLFFFLTEEPHWVEVLTEILLSLLTRQSSLYRHVVDHAFTVISPHLTSTALAMILEVCFSAIAFLVDFLMNIGSCCCVPILRQSQVLLLLLLLFGLIVEVVVAMYLYPKIVVCYLIQTSYICANLPELSNSDERNYPDWESTTQATKV